MGSYLLVLLAGLATAHEYFPEKCPSFTPMQGFDWEQVGMFKIIQIIFHHHLKLYVY